MRESKEEGDKKQRNIEKDDPRDTIRNMKKNEKKEKQRKINKKNSYLHDEKQHIQ